MTRWAFVSDIHGNLRALEAAERLAHERGAERFVCLGDVIGRGEPAACVEWVQRNAEIAIVGNRDLDYLDRVPSQLQTTVLTWGNEALASDFVASHGEPRLHRVLNSAAERDGFRRARAYMLEQGPRLWFFGHTHRARAWRLSDDGAELLSADAFDLEAKNLYVVNVGTTGLPLPGRGPASFVVYDDVVGRVEKVALGADAIVSRPSRRSALARV